MRIRHILAASAAALTIGFASPALAQDIDERGPGDVEDNVIVDDTANDFLDLLSNNEDSFNTSNDGDDNNDIDVEDNGNNRDNEYDFEDNGNNRDNEYEDNGNNRDNETYSDNDNSNVAHRGGTISNSWSMDTGNRAVATQTLVALNVNEEQVVEDLDGDYESGDNTVRGSAFAAFAGILNQAWNTGINSNAQAGTNIAAVGEVSFDTDD